MLWVWLPRYSGSALTLYRGENIDRYESGRIGSAWTEKLETAETFASGLNAEGRGGTILEVEAPPAAIIAGPSEHSRWLDENEFTLDWRRLGPIRRVRDYPPSSS